MRDDDEFDEMIQSEEKVMNTEEGGRLRGWRFTLVWLVIVTICVGVICSLCLKALKLFE